MDWVAHRARITIIGEMLRGEGNWSRCYDINSFITSNIVIDAALLPLLKLGTAIDHADSIFLPPLNRNASISNPSAKARAKRPC